MEYIRSLDYLVSSDWENSHAVTWNKFIASGGNLLEYTSIALLWRDRLEGETI
jgi:hypothetical protein